MSDGHKRAAGESAYRHFEQRPPEQRFDHSGYDHHAPHMGYPPHMQPPPYYTHPGYWPYHGYCPPGMMPPPHWQGYQQHQEMYQQPAQPNHPLVEQAQTMLESALGEEAGVFKEVLGTLGMSDREFWKGAMVGAAAALLLSNENVRGKLLELVTGARDMMQTGSSAEGDSIAQRNENDSSNMTV